MRKFHFGLILATVLLFSYQNCERVKDKPDTLQPTNVNQTVNLADENIQTVTLQSMENTTVQQNMKVYTLVSQNSYAINYINGEIIKSSDISQVTTRYCLSQGLLNELQDNG